MKSFNSAHEVATFRTPKLSDDFFDMKALFERRKTTFLSGPSRDTTRELRTGQCTQVYESVKKCPQGHEAVGECNFGGPYDNAKSYAQN